MLEKVEKDEDMEEVMEIEGWKKERMVEERI